MSFLNHIFTHIFKSLDIHKCWRIHHSHLPQAICQLAASLDKAGIEVNIEFQRLLIVSLSKSLQFLTEVAAIRIWRVSHGDIKRRGKDVEEGHGIVD